MKGDHLALYFYGSCPFCLKVERVIDELKLDVERRNIRANPDHFSALIAERGRSTVPVLRITNAGLDYDLWMPESAEIISYLRATYG